MESLTKSFDKLDFDLVEGSREVIVTISTAAVDREGDVMLPKGLKKKSYAGNPVVLWNHDLASLPIGKTLWIKADGPDRIVAKAKITDKTQLGRDVWGLLQDGIVGAASIGATILEASPPTTKELRDRPDWSNAKRVVRSWDLYEWSLVAVGMNAEAMTRAVAKGYSPETIEWLNKGKLPEARGDVWDWPEEPVQKSCTAVQLPLGKMAEKYDIPAEKFVAVVEPVVDKLASLPLPKTCRSLTSVVAKKLARLELMAEDDVMRKYLGRVN